MNKWLRSSNKRKKRGLFAWAGVIFTVISVLPISSAAFAQEFEFRFNPPDGITFVQTSKTTHVVDMGPTGKETTVIETKTRVVIKKERVAIP